MSLANVLKCKHGELSLCPYLQFFSSFSWFTKLFLLQPILATKTRVERPRKKTRVPSKASKVTTESLGINQEFCGKAREKRERDAGCIWLGLIGTKGNKIKRGEEVKSWDKIVKLRTSPSSEWALALSLRSRDSSSDFCGGAWLES